MRVLRKNQTELPHREHWQKWLLFDSGCTDWQSTPQNLLNIDFTDLVSWLYKTLRNEVKLFEVTLFKSTASFNKKPKSTIEHRKLVKMAYISFWLHWLTEHAPKSVKYRFTKFGRLTLRDHKEGAKIILKLFFLTSRRVLIKNQRALSNTEKLVKMAYIWFWLHWLAEHAPKYVKYRFTKLGNLLEHYEKKTIETGEVFHLERINIQCCSCCNDMSGYTSVDQDYLDIAVPKS